MTGGSYIVHWSDGVTYDNSLYNYNRDAIYWRADVDCHPETFYALAVF